MVGTKYLEKTIMRTSRLPNWSAVETKGGLCSEKRITLGTKQDFPHVDMVAIRRGSVGSCVARQAQRGQ